MSDDYTFEDLQADISALVQIGLIEVNGIREDGEWLYGITDKARNMTAEEIEELINSTIKE